MLIQLSVLIQLPMLIQLSSETRNILRYRQIISEGFIYDMLVEKYVVPPRNSNRKFTVSKKTIRRADCIEWHYLTQETQHYVSFEVFVL